MSEGARQGMKTETGIRRQIILGVIALAVFGLGLYGFHFFGSGPWGRGSRSPSATACMRTTRRSAVFSATRKQCRQRVRAYRRSRPACFAMPGSP